MEFIDHEWLRFQGGCTHRIQSNLQQKEQVMVIVYLVIIIAFFLASMWVVHLLDKLRSIK
jgi:NhaP-type Na+/H+ or K+/H+ antiporter